MSEVNKQMQFYSEAFASQNADHLLDTIGALHTRNKSLTKGHSTLTRRVRELEQELAYYRQKYPRTVTISDGNMVLKEGESVRVVVGKISDHPLKAVQDELREEKEPPLPPRLSTEMKGHEVRSLCRKIDRLEPAELRYKAMNALHDLADAMDGIEPEQKQVVFQGDMQVTAHNEDTFDAIVKRAIASMQDSKLFEDLRAEQQNRQAAETQLTVTVAELNQRVNRIEDGAQFAFGRGKGSTEFQRLLEQAITKGMEKALQPGGVLFTALRK